MIAYLILLILLNGMSGTNCGQVQTVDATPTISKINNVAIREDSTVPSIAIQVSDSDTPDDKLVVSVSSSNTSLVPARAITVHGGGSTRHLSITPSQNESGLTEISVTVRDVDNNSDSTTFTLTVAPVNDDPEISPIPNCASTPGKMLGPIAFTIGDQETPARQLGVTATSSNQTVVSDSNIKIIGTEANRTITITPNEKTGTAAIIVTVQDADGAKTVHPFVVEVKEKSANEETELKRIANKIQLWGIILTLIGVVITGTIAFFNNLIGRRYQSAIETRNADLKYIEQTRNAAQKKNEEERLRLDTIINSLSLLSTKDGNPVTNDQRAAVLFVLTKMKETGQAVRLASSFWNQSPPAIDAGAAVDVVNIALTTHDEDLIHLASKVLHDNAHKLYLDAAGTYVWPRVIDSKWLANIEPLSREYLLVAQMRVIFNKPKHEWGHRNLIDPLVSCYVILQNDTDPAIRTGAGQTILKLIEVVQSRGLVEPILPDGQSITLSDLRSKVEKILIDNEQQHGDQAHPTMDIEDALVEIDNWKA